MAERHGSNRRIGGHDGIEGVALTRPQLNRLTGSFLGAAVGDAVAAPFEFDRAGRWSETFPTPVLGGSGEMIGGGSFDWARGEATDDTQMAVALAWSLGHTGGFDADDLWARFRAWAAGAVDIGINTRAVLAHTHHVDAARRVHEETGRSASNGSVMRIAPVAIMGVRLGARDTVELASAQSRLTHHDPAAAAGAALVAETIRRTIITGDFEASLEDAFESVREHADPEVVAELDEYVRLLAPGFDPRIAGGHGNGSVWGAVSQAVWGVRSTVTFYDAISAVADLGGDTDTVAAITGALAGALYGRQEIPSRWTSYLHVNVDTLGGDTRTLHTPDIVDLARGLVGLGPVRQTPPEQAYGPYEVDPAGVWAADLSGASVAPTDHAIVSLCLTGTAFRCHSHRREVYMRDENGDHNPSLGAAVSDAVDAIDAFLAEGRRVVVHCHGGRSRTGLVLRAWWMRRNTATSAEAREWIDEAWPRWENWTRDFDDFLDDVWEPLVFSGGRPR